MVDFVTVPAGTYVLGDPCYSIEDDDWDFVLDKSGYFSNPETNLPDGRLVVGFHTAYGDGCYIGSNGFEYGVDAGLIGLVQVAEDYKTNNDSVSIIKFETDTICYNEDGKMQFGSIYIDTCGEDEEYEYDDEIVIEDMEEDA